MKGLEQEEHQIGARQKLNAAHIVGCIIMAAIFGSLFGSFGIFVIAAVVLIASAIESGDIRPKRPRQ